MPLQQEAHHSQEGQASTAQPASQGLTPGGLPGSSKTLLICVSEYLCKENIQNVHQNLRGPIIKKSKE